MSDHCPICGKGPDPDLRTLSVANGYELHEASTKLEKVEFAVASEPGVEAAVTLRLYQIRTCKNCRGDFIGLLRRWINGEFVDVAMREGLPKSGDEGEERNIPLRVDGATVMVTRSEWERFRAGEAIKVKEN